MPRPGKLARHGRTIFAIVVSVVSLGGCVWWATKQEAPDFPSSAGGLLLILAAAVVYGLATLIRGWRWHVILRHAGIEHKLGDAVGITTVGYTGNTVLPARGGEVLRILLLSDRSTANRREILGSIVPERILDAGALVLLFVVTRYGGLKMLKRERQAEERGEAHLLPENPAEIRVPVEH